MYTGLLGENVKAKDSLEDLGLRWRIITNGSQRSVM
jgi:hypothetical protein